MRPAYWELRVGRRASINPIVCGRKFCCGCGRWRHVCDFGRVKRRGHISLRGRCGGCLRVQLRIEARARTGRARELRREYERIYKDVKRREAGLPVRGRRRPTAVDRVERILLDAAPLVEQLEAYHRQQLSWADSENSYLALADVAGVSNRIINRLISGESQRVRLAEADRLAVAMGLTLSMLYDYEEAA